MLDNQHKSDQHKKHVRVTICHGHKCEVGGASQLEQELDRVLETRKDTLTCVRGVSECLGQCEKGPNVAIDGDVFHHMKPEYLGKFIDDKDLRDQHPHTQENSGDVAEELFRAFGLE